MVSSAARDTRWEDGICDFSLSKCMAFSLEYDSFLFKMDTFSEALLLTSDTSDAKGEYCTNMGLEGDVEAKDKSGSFFLDVTAAGGSVWEDGLLVNPSWFFGEIGNGLDKSVLSGFVNGRPFVFTITTTQ